MEPAPGLDPNDLTRWLHEAHRGNVAAHEHIFSLAYAELRRIADRQLRRERPDHTLDATSLVHEAYLKLAGESLPDLQGRAHFLGIAARAMRQILVDYARQRAAEKRGGDWQRTTLTNRHARMAVRMEEVLALDAALDRLEGVDARLRQVVEMSFFGGLSDTEIADVLGLSVRTVQRDWIKARAWLYKELYPRGG